MDSLHVMFFLHVIKPENVVECLTLFYFILRNNDVNVHLETPAICLKINMVRSQLIPLL